MRDWNAEVRRRLEDQQLADGVPPDVVEEVAQHIADAHRSALLAGATEAETEARVAREFDNLRALAMASARRQRPPALEERRGWLPQGLASDVVHALRLLRIKPGYSTVVVATLAIGIGACTAVFSLFNSLLLAPLPFPEPERLVLLWETAAQQPGETFIVAEPNYGDWARETTSFEALGIWEYRSYNIAATGAPEQVHGIRASASLFDVLGVAPALGRTFTAVEDEPGHRVVVISDAVWRIHFAAARDVLGKEMSLNGASYEVIGVMPRGFDFPGQRNGVWTPIAVTTRDHERGAHSFFVAARLRRGTTIEQARDEVERLGETMRRKYPENADEGATVQAMREYGVANTRRVLAALAGAVGLVLLIACVNVAGLQLASGMVRRREFVTRLALGARVAHLARQAAIEALCLAAIGGALGLALAWFAARAADLILSPGFRSLPFRGEVRLILDDRVLLFALLLSTLSALLFAFMPLIGLRRPALQPLLRKGGRGSTQFAGAARHMLIGAEVALAIVVLSGAGLMVRSLVTLLAVEPGLDPVNVLTMQVALPQEDTYGAPERVSLCSNLAREVGALPGVLHVSAISHLPLSGGNASRALTIEGRAVPSPSNGPSANYRLACPGYFAALGIPLLAGRDFEERDGRDGQPVVIVNRSMARLYWPESNPIGQRLKLGWAEENDNPWLTVVGVVEDVRHFGLEAQPRREIYRPYSQSAWPVLTVVVKTRGEPMAWQRAVRERLVRVETNLPAAGARSMEDVLSQSVAWRQTPMRLLSGFALIGLLLAGLGIYGVLAYYVSQRTRELGVRVALGASPRALVALVLRQSAVPIAIGVALGVIASLGSGRLLNELLYEVRPGDPLVLTSVIGLLLVVAVLSSVIPARRAAKLDPLAVLREE